MAEAQTLGPPPFAFPRQLAWSWIGSEVKQLGHELVPIWKAGIIGGDSPLIHNAGPKIH